MNDEPTTPTGKRLWSEPGAFKDALYQRRLRTILDIEAEAREQERERLRVALRSHEDDWESYVVYETDRGHEVIGLEDVERLLAD